MAGFTFVFQASGKNPNSLINAAPSAGPQSSPGWGGESGHGIASLGLVSLSTVNIGISTYKCAVCLRSPPVGSAEGSVIGWQIGVCISWGSDWAFFPLK